MFVKLEQSQKAYSFISETELGITTFFKFLQYLKVAELISVIKFGRITLSKLLQL